MNQNGFFLQLQEIPFQVFQYYSKDSSSEYRIYQNRERS